MNNHEHTHCNDLQGRKVILFHMLITFTLQLLQDRWNRVEMCDLQPLHHFPVATYEIIEAGVQ